MKKVLYIVGIWFFLSACNGHQNQDNNEVVVFCAASFSSVIAEIAEQFESDKNITVKINAASSGTLARQIEHGASPDMFISANKKWMNYLNDSGKTTKEYNAKIAGNKMVLAAPANSDLQPVKFSKELILPELFKGRLVLGDQQHVPAGMYAAQIIENMGWKNQLEHRLLTTKDARSALMVVELGEVEAGIVYKTDAQKSKKVKIITEFPDSLYDPVHYYIAIIQGQKNENSLSLYNYMMSKEAERVWKKYGFTE